MHAERNLLINSVMYKSNRQKYTFHYKKFILRSGNRAGSTSVQHRWSNNAFGDQQTRQQKDPNITGPVRQSCHTKTGTPERQTGGLGQRITVQKKQLCCDLRTGKQAGQNSLGTYDATTDVCVVSIYNYKLFKQSLTWFCEY